MEVQKARKKTFTNFPVPIFSENKGSALEWGPCTESEEYCISSTSS